MPFSVWCSVAGCRFEIEDVENVDRIYDLQEFHTDHFGDHHVLEFERTEASVFTG